MIDLTPLDVRNKRGDFRKAMRGYEPHEVDLFLEMAADRLETLVRENLQLRERTQTLQTQVTAQNDREQAVQDALVTAQELRADIRTQSQREADHLIREAEVESRRMIAEADEVVRDRLRGIERQLDQASRSVEELERRRARFLTEFRGLLVREMDVVQVEESRVPLEARAIDLDLGPGPSADGATGEQARHGVESRDPDSSLGTVPFETPDTEALPEESDDTIIPAGVDPFFSSDPTPLPDDLVPLGGVSGSIAAGVGGLDFESSSRAEEHVADHDQDGDDPVSYDEQPPIEGLGQAAEAEHAHESSADPATEVSGRGWVRPDSGDDHGLEPDAPAAMVDPAPGPAAGIQSDLSVPMDVDSLRPDMGTGMPEPEVFASEAEAYHEQRYGARPDPTVLPVDVADLGPSAAGGHVSAGPPPLPGSVAPDPAHSAAPAPEPTARVEGPAEDHDRFAGIPDLETVLAEAGVDDTTAPPEEVAPPPVKPDDPILLFDPDNDDPYRR